MYVYNRTSIVFMRKTKKKINDDQRCKDENVHLLSMFSISYRNVNNEDIKLLLFLDWFNCLQTVVIIYDIYDSFLDSTRVLLSFLTVPQFGWTISMNDSTTVLLDDKILILVFFTGTTSNVRVRTTTWSFSSLVKWV